MAINDDIRKAGQNRKDEVALVCDFPEGTNFSEALSDKIAAAYDANGKQPLTPRQVLDIVEALQGPLPIPPISRAADLIGNDKALSKALRNLPGRKDRE